MNAHSRSIYRPLLPGLLLGFIVLVGLAFLGMQNMLPDF